MLFLLLLVFINKIIYNYKALNYLRPQCSIDFFNYISYVLHKNLIKRKHKESIEFLKRKFFVRTLMLPAAGHAKCLLYVFFTLFTEFQYCIFASIKLN